MSARRRISRAERASNGKPRAGFTLVELLVAMIIFAVGMLGLAATAGSVTRMMGGARRQTIAAQVAQSRIERLRASPCTALTGGSETVRGVTNIWTVTAVTRGVNVTDSVVFATSRGGTRSRVYKTTLSC
jgi:type IV pilus assembly protein PilV